MKFGKPIKQKRRQQTREISDINGRLCCDYILPPVPFYNFLPLANS